MKINNIEKLSFGLGGGVNAIKTDFFVWYLGAYYLTVLGLNPILTGSALLFALFVDAISDPLIGALSDRIKSSFGRRHIFMGFSLVPISITYFMLFICLVRTEIPHTSTYYPTESCLDPEHAQFARLFQIGRVRISIGKQVPSE